MVYRGTRRKKEASEKNEAHFPFRASKRVVSDFIMLKNPMKKNIKQEVRRIFATQVQKYKTLHPQLFVKSDIDQHALDGIIGGYRTETVEEKEDALVV